jgi:serine protease Do
VDVIPFADAFDSGEQHGALVIGVRDGSAAAKADIRARDVIVTYNGKEVRDLDDLRRLVRESAVGAQVKVEILREGKRISLDVTFDGRKP